VKQKPRRMHRCSRVGIFFLPFPEHKYKVFGGERYEMDAFVFSGCEADLRLRKRILVGGGCRVKQVAEGKRKVLYRRCGGGKG
jgi:hypothetical protein